VDNEKDLVALIRHVEQGESACVRKEAVEEYELDSDRPLRIEEIFREGVDLAKWAHLDDLKDRAERDGKYVADTRGLANGRC